MPSLCKTKGALFYLYYSSRMELLMWGVDFFYNEEW